MKINDISIYNASRYFLFLCKIVLLEKEKCLGLKMKSVTCMESENYRTTHVAQMKRTYEINENDSCRRGSHVINIESG